MKTAVAFFCCKVEMLLNFYDLSNNLEKTSITVLNYNNISQF